MCKGTHNLSSVEFNATLSKASLFLQVEEQLSSIDVIKDHVQFIFCLEGIVEVHNERVLNLHQYLDLIKLKLKYRENNAQRYIFLSFSMGNLLTCNNGIFPKHLHGINLAIILLAHLHDLQTYKKN